MSALVASYAAGSPPRGRGGHYLARWFKSSAVGTRSLYAWTVNACVVCLPNSSQGA